MDFLDEIIREQKLLTGTIVETHLPDAPRPPQLETDPNGDIQREHDKMVRIATRNIGFIQNYIDIQSEQFKRNIKLGRNLTEPIQQLHKLAGALQQLGAQFSQFANAHSGDYRYD